MLNRIMLNVGVNLRAMIVMKRIEFWKDLQVTYFGECWDCGKNFRNRREIKIGWKQQPMHKSCARRRVWKGNTFFDACTITQIKPLRARTPLLFKKGDDVNLTFPDGYEPIQETYNNVTAFYGVKFPQSN